MCEHGDNEAGYTDAKLDALRAALAEGEASGPAEPFDFEAFIARERAADAAEHERSL